MLRLSHLSLCGQKKNVRNKKRVMDALEFLLPHCLLVYMGFSAYYACVTNGVVINEPGSFGSPWKQHWPKRPRTRKRAGHKKRSLPQFLKFVGIFVPLFMQGYAL